MSYRDYIYRRIHISFYISILNNNNEYHIPNTKSNIFSYLNVQIVKILYSSLMEAGADAKP